MNIPMEFPAAGAPVRPVSSLWQSPGKRAGKLSVLSICLALLAAFLLGGVGHAQVKPTIATNPGAARAGAVVWLSGQGFGTDNVPATILWDGQTVKNFIIPQGGSFGLPLVIPGKAGIGEHTIRVCAGSPCFTDGRAASAEVKFTVTGSRPAVDADIAFLFKKDEETATAFAKLLGSHGLRTQLLPWDRLLATDLSRFRLIIIGADTGNDQEWGASENELKHLSEQTHFLGIGPAGAVFFDKLPTGPDMGWRYALASTLNTLEVGDVHTAFYRQPFDASALGQYEPLPLYTEPVEGVVMPYYSETARTFGYKTRDTAEATIVSGGCNLLWGYAGHPRLMTDAGQALFVNAVVQATLATCDRAAAAACEFTTDAEVFAQTALIDFDKLPDGAIVADHYAPTHGVRFENNRLTRAIIYADREADATKARSAPNVVTNSAQSPNTSANVPLTINFSALQKGAGFYLGNGENAGLTALLTAYDSRGNLLCRGTYSPVPEPYEVFMGVSDTGGRIARLELDYGNSLLSESVDDLRLDPTRIRVCRQTSRGCLPAANATVDVSHKDGSKTELATDGNGYVQDRSRIQNGDLLWVRALVGTENRKSLYYTHKQPVEITPERFAAGDGEMLVELDYPLIVHDLAVSTQWNLEGDSTYRTTLINNIVKASNYFYDFTDGQMALGTVTVYQNYDKWDEADIRLYASNSLRPSAVIGGVSAAPVNDPLVAGLTYYPGHIFMGSAWNRFGLVSAPDSLDLDLSNDWSLAMAHELGHYLLFLFDTYLSQISEDEYIEINSCTGSAMGWVYDEINTEFVADEAHWKKACGVTLANQIQGRTEWATIRLWYNMLIAPTVVNPGPPAPPAPLTTVTFVPPSDASPLLANQTFDLQYVESETASPAARGFLIRNNRVLDQGKPIVGSTQLTLQGAQVNDRFCLFDVAHSGISRRQFGCKSLEPADSELPMKKDLNWAPMIEVSPITSKTIAISVTQPLAAGPTMIATLYPEDENTATQITLALTGDRYTGIFNSPIPAMSAFVGVAVNEAATPANPRREVIIDYGVGGSGAKGPVSMFGGAPVISSDGQAQFAPSQRIDLAEGEFVAWQSMVGQPPAPSNQRFVGQAYRLIALPSHLANDGVISIRTADGSVATARSAGSQQAPVLHYWKDNQWTPLPSEQHTAVNGDTMISGRSQGVGFYTLLAASTGNELYLPLVNR